VGICGDVSSLRFSVATVALPLTAHAQQPTMPVIGYLYGGSPEASANFVAAFRKGLSEAGYVEGQNVAIEYLWTHNDNDRLPELAADLVRRRVAVIVTPNFVAAALAAKAATTTIPIVFGGGFDPVQAGLVASLNRPGGNVTGVSFMTVETGGKRVGLLHELLPGAAAVDQHRAGAALRKPTPEFGAVELEIVAKHVEQRRVRLRRYAPTCPIHFQADSHDLNSPSSWISL
jgi:ABC-type uncharacterized transport system substrate-binding protein